MISAYLAEDEPLARAALEAMLRTSTDFQVVGQCDNGEQALKECQELRPDVLFADIRMPILDGLTLAAAVTEHCPRTQVVFITAYDQHAVQAFRLAAVDYLLKPVAAADFQACLDRVRRGHSPERAALHPHYREYFIVKSIGHVDVVAVRDIIAIRASGNYLELITAQGRHLHRQTVRTVLNQLDPTQFVQVHRSVVIAVKHVRRVEQREGSILACMDGELRLPVSASFHSQLKAILSL